MKIGILGSGAVAHTLATAWADQGHEIYIGARRPNKPALAQLLKEHQTIQSGTLAEAADFGEVILLAINPWTEIQTVLMPLKDKLRGKILIDVSNNIVFGDQPALAFADKSMGEYVQQTVPETFVVKTLNITPAAMMARPHQSGITPAIGWVSGNNDTAKQKISLLLQDLGWDEIIDLGDIHKSMLQENIGLALTLVISSLQS